MNVLLFLHCLSGRFREQARSHIGFGELFPLIDDAINVQHNEFGKMHGGYLSMNRGTASRIVVPLAGKT
jgi:hypothetical protein